ncbi:uncharacterized protein A4U43_C05F580 [Asparagus officinalis]|uniref:Sodium/calcium exchanger membrane region domain-containing protein n=1 Tax=Asparagus officinalis TaxID=4686 RepID=A0A5P1ES00_ASPOF|nr:uncharacterized protein A4U43_C05F580 [Asparagus officinalis]
MAVVTLLALGNDAPDLFSSVATLRCDEPRTDLAHPLRRRLRHKFGFDHRHAFPFGSASIHSECLLFSGGAGDVLCVFEWEMYLWQGVGFVGLYVFFVGLVFWMDLGSTDAFDHPADPNLTAEIGDLDGSNVDTPAEGDHPAQFDDQLHADPNVNPLAQVDHGADPNVNPLAEVDHLHDPSVGPFAEVDVAADGRDDSNATAAVADLMVQMLRLQHKLIVVMIQMLTLPAKVVRPANSTVRPPAKGEDPAYSSVKPPSEVDHPANSTVGSEVDDHACCFKCRCKC